MKRLALVALLALAGCPHRGASPLGGAIDAAPLWEQVKAAHAREGTLTADGKAFVDAPQNGGKYSLHLSVRRPSSLRLEALTPLGDPAAVLVTDQGRFALFDLRANQFYRGPSTPENLSRLFPVPLRDDELVSLFLGGVPELPGAQPVSAVREGDHFKLVLATTDPALATVRGLSQEVLVHEGDLRILMVSRGVAGGPDQVPLWTVTLEEHDDGLPRIVKLTVPAKGIVLDLRLKNLLVGKPPPFGAFALQPPAGVEVIDLDQAPP